MPCCHIKKCQKSLVLSFKRTYALSVVFKMKPLRKSVFLCYGKKQLKICRKSCPQEQLFFSYLFDESLRSSIYTLQHVFNRTPLEHSLIELILSTYEKSVTQPSFSFNKFLYQLSKTKFFSVSIVNINIMMRSFIVR